MIIPFVNAALTGGVTDRIAQACEQHWSYYRSDHDMVTIVVGGSSMQEVSPYMRDKRKDSVGLTRRKHVARKTVSNCTYRLVTTISYGGNSISSFSTFVC